MASQGSVVYEDLPEGVVAELVCGEEEGGDAGHGRGGGGSGCSSSCLSAALVFIGIAVVLTALVYAVNAL